MDSEKIINLGNRSMQMGRKATLIGAFNAVGEGNDQTLVIL